MAVPSHPKFKIEFQYQKFLQTIGLDESKMPTEQKEQLRMTFMAAFGQSLSFLRDDVSPYPERVAVEIMESMEKEVKAYFINISNSQN